MMLSDWMRILLLMVVTCVAPLSHACAKDTTSILLFGDSIIAGYGLAAEESVPVRLQELLREKRPKAVVINGGVSGDTTSGGRTRLAWMLDKHRPDLVVLALGGNDLLRGVSPEVTRENIGAMLETLRQAKIPAVLSAVRAPANLGVQYQARFDAIYTDAAKKYDVPLYPFLLTETFGKSELMQGDGIHPNSNGALVIARGLAAYIERLPVMAK